MEAEGLVAPPVTRNDDSSSFLSLYLAYLAHDDPATFPNIQQLISKWNEIGFFLLGYEQLSSSPAPILVDGFSFSFESRLLSAPHLNHLVETYTWDIFDKIFDYVISTPLQSAAPGFADLVNGEFKGSIDIRTMMACITSIADKVKAKELYIMAIEKMITIRNNAPSTALLQLQLFALQKALVPLLQGGDTDHLVSGLSIVVQQISSIVDVLSKNYQHQKTNPEEDGEKLLDVWDDILRVALIFYDGIHLKATTWHDKAVEPANLNGKFIPTDEESKQGVSMAAFLLQLSAKCVLHHPDRSWRIAIMTKISHRLLSNFLSLDDILVHPFRLRYRILREKMKEIQRKEKEANNILSSRVVKRLRDEVESQSDEVVDIGLFQSVPIRHRRQLIDLAKSYLATEKKSAIDKDRRHLTSSANIIAWKDVKDDEQISMSTVSIGSSVEDQYFHPKLPWSMVGLTMFAQAVMDPFQSLNSEEEKPNFLSSVYSPGHIYDMFSIYLTSMLQMSPQIPEEGLSMANQLAQITSSGPHARALIKYLPHSLHFQNSSTVPVDIQILEEMKRCPAASDIRAMGIISASSSDALQLLQSLINSIASCPDNKRRIEGYMALKSMLMMFEERSRLAILRKLIDDCPFSSLTGLLVDIVRDNCQLASRKSSEDLALLTLSSKDGSRSDIDQSMEIFLWPGKHSPFWSPLVLRLFVDKLFGSLSTMPISEIVSRIDEINATVALLQFIVVRVEASSSLSTELVAQPLVVDESKKKVKEILYPVLLNVQGARKWIMEKLTLSQIDDAEVLRVQLLSCNLDHLWSSMKRFLENGKENYKN